MSSCSCFTKLHYWTSCPDMHRKKILSTWACNTDMKLGRLPCLRYLDDAGQLLQCLLIAGLHTPQILGLHDVLSDPGTARFRHHLKEVLLLWSYITAVCLPVTCAFTCRMAGTQRWEWDNVLPVLPTERWRPDLIFLPSLFFRSCSKHNMHTTWWHSTS